MKLIYSIVVAIVCCLTCGYVSVDATYDTSKNYELIKTKFVSDSSIKYLFFITSSHANGLCGYCDTFKKGVLNTTKFDEMAQKRGLAVFFFDVGFTDASYRNLVYRECDKYYQHPDESRTLPYFTIYYKPPTEDQVVTNWWEKNLIWHIPQSRYNGGTKLINEIDEKLAECTEYTKVEEEIKKEEEKIPVQTETQKYITTNTIYLSAVTESSYKEGEYIPLTIRRISASDPTTPILILVDDVLNTTLDIPKNKNYTANVQLATKTDPDYQPDHKTKVSVISDVFSRIDLLVPMKDAIEKEDVTFISGNGAKWSLDEDCMLLGYSTNSVLSTVHVTNKTLYISQYLGEVCSVYKGDTYVGCTRTNIVITCGHGDVKLLTKDVVRFNNFFE